MFVALPGTEPLALDLTEPKGREPWVVFLHGLGSSRQGEKALYLEEQLVPRGFGFARFDFRGHGDSGGLLEQLTLTRQLEDLRRVLAHLQRQHGLSRAVMVGSSLGGLTSALHCAGDPAPVEAQVLIAPAFRIVERYLEAMGPVARERWQREGTFTFHGPWFDFDLHHDIVTDCAAHSHEDLVRRTAVPTWILHGTADESVPVELSRDFARRAPAVTRLETIEGGSHRMTEHKERLLALTLEALETTDRAPPSSYDPVLS